jgi:hypothetical protein
VTTSSQLDQNNHHPADDLLEEYLLGTLPAEDAAWMQSHLQTCDRCQAEIGPLMEAVQGLPFAAPDPDIAMSDDVWGRIERSIATGPSRMGAREDFVPLPSADTPPRDRWAKPSVTRFTPRQWIAIAAMLVAALIGGAVLGQVLPRIGQDDEANAQQIAIEFTDPSITANGQLLYLPDEKVFVLEISGMPEPPQGFVYQAWLIENDTPIPVGVMNTETGEFASAGDRQDYQTFAITLEEGPLGNEAPTTKPIMVANLSDTDAS